MRMLVCLLFVSASANVVYGDVLNGSFESAPLPMPDRVQMSMLTDWTSTGGSSLLERGVNSVSQIVAHSGAQFVSMGHNGASGDTLFQLIETTPGTDYTVSFVLHCIQGDATQSVLASAISGGPLGSVEGTVSSRTQGWVAFSFSFQATQAQTQIRFVHNLGADSANVAIDSVSVVPSPMSAAILIFGAAASARRRRITR